jgi:hypothetical protein
VEHHTLAVERAHHADDVLALVGVAEGVLAHVAAGGELHLLVLQVEARLGEAVPVADVIVVQVGDDDVLDLPGVDVEVLQQFGRIGLDLAAALLADLGIEAGVDHDRLAADRPVALLVERDRHPDEIVHREVGIVQVGRDLDFPRLARQMGVFNSMHLVDGRRTHFCFLPVALVHGSLARGADPAL